MGILISRWRKPRSTSDELSKIQAEMEAIEKFKRSTQVHQRTVVKHLLIYCATAYLAAGVLVYFRYWYRPDWRDWTSRLLLLSLFLVSPFLMLFLKRVLTWWYHRKIRGNESQLSALVARKTKILNEVMEKETYKVAKEILEKYAPEQLGNANKSQLSRSIAPTPNRPSTGVSKPVSHTPSSSTPSHAQTGLRQRANATPSQAPATPPKRTPINTPMQRIGGGGGANPTPNVVARTTAGNNEGARGPPGPPLPRPVMSRDRGYMDRVVEFLVGDGPSNRYALICKQCQSHNGMALKEEFEYVAYRCCYCYTWNPARKQRPVAPRLPTQNILRQSSTESSEEEAPSSTSFNELRTEKKEEESKPEKKEEESKSEKKEEERKPEKKEEERKPEKKEEERKTEKKEEEEGKEEEETKEEE